jgi:hypothetical protein
MFHHHKVKLPINMSQWKQQDEEIKTAELPFKFLALGIDYRPANLQEARDDGNSLTVFVYARDLAE